MDIGEKIKKVLQDFILPELETINGENEVKRLKYLTTYQ